MLVGVLGAEIGVEGWGNPAWMGILGAEMGLESRLEDSEGEDSGLDLWRRYFASFCVNGISLTN